MCISVVVYGLVRLVRLRLRSIKAETRDDYIPVRKGVIDMILIEMK